MGEEGRNSAQCAWLFRHAHLIGEFSIQFDDGEEIHFGSSALEDAFSLSFVVFSAADFFPAAGFFLTVFAGFASLERRAAAFAFASILRCCFARSSRKSSSW